MSDYKPSTEELRQVWGMFSEYGGLVDRPEETLIDERYAEFDGWLAVVKAETWTEGCKAGLDAGLTVGEHVLGIKPGRIPAPPANPYKDAP